MIYSEKWGTSIEEAVRLALSDLKLTIDEVNVIVLEEPSKGFFGLGNKLAKVRVEKKEVMETPKVEEPKAKVDIKPKAEERAPQKPEIKAEAKIETKPEIKAEAKIETKTEKKPEPKFPQKREKETKEGKGTFSSIQKKPDGLKPLADHEALTFIRETVSKMGLKLTVAGKTDDECIYIEISGDDSGTIIGKRGQTLDALQYLTSLVANKNKEKYVRVVIDAENYRAKREKTLEQLALRLAEKVVKSRKPVRLEPMNPYERKVIHSTLQSHTKVTTRSEGEEPYRRVIIELK